MAGGWEIEGKPVETAQAPAQSGWMIEGKPIVAAAPVAPATPVAPPAQPGNKFGSDYPGAPGPVQHISKYTLPNGAQTDMRGDSAVWLEPSKGFGGKPGWYYVQPSPERGPRGEQQFYMNPAPDVEATGTVSAQPNPEFAQRYGEALKDAEKQRREFIRDRSVYDPQTGTYKYQGPPLENAPLTLATDPGLGQGYLKRKGIGVGKALVGGVGQIAQGVAGAAELGLETMNPLLMAGKFMTPEQKAAHPELAAAAEREQALNQPVINQIEAARQRAAARTAQYGTPSASQTSLASNVAGMAPIVAAAATTPEALAPAAMGSIFAGQARGEIQDMRQQINPATGQPFQITPGQEYGYEALNLGLGALPIGPIESGLAKSVLPEAAGAAMQRGILGPAAKEAATFAALSGAPTAYRKYVLGDQSADVLGSMEESAKTGLLFGGLMAGGKYYFGERPKPIPAFAEPPITPEEAQQRIATLASTAKGMTPLEYAEAARVPVSSARDILSGLASDPDHPVQNLGDGRYGVPEPRATGNPGHEAQLGRIRDNAIENLTAQGLDPETAGAYADEHVNGLRDMAGRTGIDPIDLEREMPLLAEAPAKEPEAAMPEEAAAEPTGAETQPEQPAQVEVKPTERRSQSPRGREIRELTEKKNDGTITPEESSRLTDLLVIDRSQGKLGNQDMPGVQSKLAYLDQYHSGKLKKHQFFLDLDMFKLTNDTFGHAVGDQGIMAFGKSLAKHLPPDSVFHLSGDEFVLNVDDADATRKALEKVREDMAGFTYEGKHIETGRPARLNGLGFSYGEAGVSDHMEPVDPDPRTGLPKNGEWQPVPYHEAERAALANKQERKAQGLRFERGEGPSLEIGEAPEKPPVTMQIKQGKQTLKIPLSDPAHIARYERAQRQFDQMKALIKANTELTPQERHQAYKAQGDALKFEKLSIKQEIEQKQADAIAKQMPGPDLLEAVADKSIGKAAPVVGQQAAAMRLQQRNSLRDLAVRAIKAGASTAKDFRDIVAEQTANSPLKNVSESDLNSIFREARGKVTAESVVPRIRGGEDKANYMRRVAEWLKNQGTTSYEGNYKVPDIPRNDITERDAPEPPMRDLGPRERGYRGPGETKIDFSAIASPNQLLSGVWNTTLGPLWRNGFSPVAEALSANFMRDSLMRSFYDWGRDILGGVPSGAKIVGDLNGKLASTYLSNIADMWPVLEDAKRAEAAGDRAFNEFLSTPRGQQYERLTNENKGIVRQILKNNARAAVESAGSRIIQYAESTPGSEAEGRLARMMQPEEVKKAEAIRAFYTQARNRLNELGIPTLGPNEMYVTHTGFEQYAKDGYKKLQDVTRTTNKDQDKIQEVLSFAHRQMGAPNFFPDAGLSLNAYIDPVSRKIAYQGWLNKWMPLIEANFVTDNNPAGAPRAASYLRELTKDVLYRNDTALDKIANGVANFEHLRTLSGSLTTPFKHLFKTLGIMAENGVRPTAMAGLESAALLAPRSVIENEALSRFAKNLGVDVQKIKDIKQITESFRRSREINRQLDAMPGLSEFTTNLFKQAAQKAIRAGSAPLTLVEAWSRGVNVLATMYRADKANMRPDEAFRQAIHNTAALDFYGSWDNPGFQRSGLGRMLTLYQQTPFKMAEQYLNWALKPDAVDAFGTKNGIKFFRYAVALGVLAAIGDSTDTPIVGHVALHPPFIGPDYQTGKYGVLVPQPLDDLHNIFSEQKAGIANLDTWVNILHDTGTVQGLKYSRSMKTDIPKMYAGSKTRYILGLPKTSIMEQEQEAQAQKAEKGAKTRAQKFLKTITPEFASQEAP